MTDEQPKPWATDLVIDRAIDRAIDRIMGVEIEAMNGDNLAVVLCSHFDRDDGSESDDNGWSQAATDAYDEIRHEIAGLFVPVREEIDLIQRTFAEREAELVGALRAAIGALEDDSGIDEAICCSGHECGCHGSSHRQLLIYNLSAALKSREAGHG